jgi:hypothetical protein
MRHLYFLSLITFLSFSVSQADIIRVNNSTGISADFSDLQAAIDSANSGDTIYVEPSSTNYGNISVTKRLSIYGPGYFLAENTGLQANVNTSKVAIFTLTASSAFSTIAGLVITNYLEVFAGNVAITRCRFTINTTCLYFNGTISNTNVLIAQNYFEAGGIGHGSGIQSYTVYWRNNYFGGTTINTEGPGIVNDFTNNVFDTYSFVVRSSVFVNNIFNSQNSFDLGTVGWNNGLQNNIFRNLTNSIDTSLGNVEGVNTPALFIGTGQSSTDGQWQIVPGSLADDFGKEIPTGTPTDAGMYGGPNPYKLSGVPAIPTIYDLVVPTSNTTGGLNVTIKAKSQD